MNFIFNRKKLAESGLFQGFTDAHCHILPGVDDGVQTMEESLAILDCYKELGVQEVWFTPHIMEDVPNKPTVLRQRFEDLQAAYQGPLTLHLSAENMLDSIFQERFEQDDLLPWGKNGNRLLVETSYFKGPSNFDHILQRIAAKGYFPLLAHPERYLYMDKPDYRSLKQRGMEFQLNLFSLLGFYGHHAKEKAEFLLREGFYDYVATDLHSIGVLQDALLRSLSKKTIRLIEQIGK